MCRKRSSIVKYILDREYIDGYRKYFINSLYSSFFMNTCEHSDTLAQFNVYSSQNNTLGYELSQNCLDDF